MSSNSSSYYDSGYFDWQKDVGQFGGKAEVWKFQPYINQTDKVLDFGCGGGFVLKNLSCAEKLGVEINPSARSSCSKLGIEAVADISGVPDNWADVIISNHALEHVSDPLDTLKALRHKIRPGGVVIFVVPCESVKTRFERGNIDRHLFTWSPMNIGNLFEAAGYSVSESKALLHRWMTKPRFVQNIVGWNLFHFGCWIYGRLFTRLSQVRVIAHRVT